MLTDSDLSENTIANLGTERLMSAMRAFRPDQGHRTALAKRLLLDSLAMEYLAMTGAFVSEMFDLKLPTDSDSSKG